MLDSTRARTGPLSDGTLAPPLPPAGQVDHPSRPVRRALVRLVQEQLATLPGALVDCGTRPPVIVRLVEATVADLDRYARQGRLPRRPDLYGFRAYGALAGAAGIDEDALVEWITTAVDSVERLWCAGADTLISEFSADAVDRALACLCGIATMWERKVQGQLQAGLTLAATVRPVAA